MLSQVQRTLRVNPAEIHQMLPRHGQQTAELDLLYANDAVLNAYLMRQLGFLAINKFLKIYLKPSLHRLIVKSLEMRKEDLQFGDVRFVRGRFSRA